MVFRTCIKWVAGGRTLTQVRFERQGGTLWPLDRASPGSTSPCRGSVFCGDPVLGRLSPRGAKDGPSHLRLCLVLPEVVEREGLFPQHPWQFQGQLWYKQFGRVVIAESVGHQDIGVSPEVVGGGRRGAHGHFHPKRRRAGSGTRGPREACQAPERNELRDVGAHCSPERSPGLCLSSAPVGQPVGLCFWFPGKARLLAVTLGHLSCAQLTTQRGRVGWGGGGEQSDLTSSALPPPTTSASWGGRTSRLALRGFPGSACGHECPGVTDWRWMGAPSGPTCASVRVLPLPAFVPSPPDSPLLPEITPLEWHSFRLLSLSQGWP